MVVEGQLRIHTIIDSPTSNEVGHPSLTTRHWWASRQWHPTQEHTVVPFEAMTSLACIYPHPTSPLKGEGLYVPNRCRGLRVY